MVLELGIEYGSGVRDRQLTPFGHSIVFAAKWVAVKDLDAILPEVSYLIFSHLFGGTPKVSFKNVFVETHAVLLDYMLYFEDAVFL